MNKLIAAGVILVVLAFAWAFRFETIPVVVSIAQTNDTPGYIRVNRWTGEIRFCSMRECVITHQRELRP
jgi:hypothetical protein